MEQGTLYEQAISVGGWTLPVHASLFTGLFPVNHGVTVSKDALPDTWELCGYDVDADGIIEVDLPGMGADHRHMDVFVEVDCDKNVVGAQDPDSAGLIVFQNVDKGGTFCV